MMSRSLTNFVARGALIVVALAILPPPAPAATPASDPIVATVGGLPIRASEVKARKSRVEDVYRQRTGRPVPDGYGTFFERSALDELVHDRLVLLDAQSRGVVVSEAAAESLLRADDDFNRGGRFDAAGYARYKRDNPKGFQDAMRQAREALLVLRHGEAIQRELEPEPEELERLWQRRYGRVRAQAVYVPELDPAAGPEPSDDEVAAEYARHPADYTWPAQLDYTILSVLTPESDAAARAERVERVLAEARVGLPFDSLARRHGGHLSRHEWTEGRDARGFETRRDLLEQALASPAGTVLPEAVTSDEGFYLVRVERSRPRGTAPLARVAGDVRVRLAEKRALAARESEARKLYDANPKAWVVPARQVRWAIVDSARVRLKPPSDAELTAWYDAHSAAFARVDPAGGGVRVPPLADVKAQAIELWQEEQRAAETRRLADELAVAWAAGRSAKKSDAVTLSGPTWLADDGTRPAGIPEALADSVNRWPAAGRAIVAPDARGYAVVHLMKIDPAAKATFEMAEPRIRARLAETRAARDSAEARAWYDAHRERYTSGRGFSIVWVPVRFPDPSVVNVPRDAIERFYRERKGELGTPEQVRLRHILVRPGAAGWAQAEARAGALLARIRGGEDFVAVARAESDDPLTSRNGGDMGWLKRGFAPGPFEEAAFALTRERPLSAPVRTEFGVHLIRLDDRREPRTPTYEESRVEIGRRLAVEYADTLALRTAERIRDTTPDARQLFERGEKERYASYRETWFEGTPATGALENDAIRAALLAAEPGTILPLTPRHGTNVYLVIGVDSVLAPRVLPFDAVRERALADARHAAAGGASRSSRADRLARDLEAGKAWDAAIDRAGNATEPFVARVGEIAATIPVVPGLDSLLFGVGPGALEAGQWRRVPDAYGDWFVRVSERIPPDASAEAQRGRLRTVVLNRRLYDYDEELRSRHRVIVLDDALSERLPPPPALP
jgi:parvulin-like peptidyl-prolyl isomerase